ncbi:hypothetical protein F2Q68_00019733 [Brassica cretica]|uniref:Uncharacterized protein n=1 Tax=Brassica cretica TaxID=69181 RepID=A0A8S9FVN0_BRACR|nr:hypothetical protein F2Q68_00019733 [Brassica cretica]
MPPESRLSREVKGKGIADSPSPTRDASATDSPLDDFDLIHRDALRDTENMTLDILHISIVLSIHLCIGVPHGVLGDIWVCLELERGVKMIIGQAERWERLPGATPSSRSDCLIRATLPE